MDKLIFSLYIPIILLLDNLKIGAPDQSKSLLLKIFISEFICSIIP